MPLPTVVTYKLSDDWKTAFQATAEVLNQSDKAAEVLAAYAQEAAAFKAEHATQETTISIVRWNADGPVVMTPNSFASLVATDLGLNRPAEQQTMLVKPGHMHSEPLSLEQIAVLDADWLFIGTLNPDGLTAMQNAQQNPLFQQLHAVKNKQTAEVDGTVWTSRGGPLAALVVLKDIRTAVEK